MKLHIVFVVAFVGLLSSIPDKLLRSKNFHIVEKTITNVPPIAIYDDVNYDNRIPRSSVDIFLDESSIKPKTSYQDV
uniref:Seminal fluid protein HACP016 n=1 Tax=Strongyloides venezuelensis TaxID=75913 RepID=A0A0K0FNI6_STRVS